MNPHSYIVALNQPPEQGIQIYTLTTGQRN
uniref:Uncharacterized protein n=1 Tax=Anguilla anguilla TaxID=7936 RepID=A0A0E9QWT9_ANGAN